MKEKLDVCILFFVFVGFASCIEIVLTPDKDNLVKRENDGLSLTCKVEGLSEGEKPEIQWFSVDGTQVTANSGRVKVHSFGSTDSLNLIISNLQDGDDGQYTCRANVNGNAFEKNIALELYRGITIKGSPRLQRPNIYTDAFIECNADANPVPTVHWMFANETAIPSGGRYVQQRDGIVIKNITEADNGIYYCMINVGSMGDFKQYNITIQVTIPPKFDRPASSTDAIVGKNFEMTCSATGNPPPLFTFYKDDNPNPLDTPKFKVDKTNGKLVADVMEENDSGKYKCVASNENEGVRGTTGGQIEQTLDIIVRIPPKVQSVSEEKALMDARGELTCVSEGNPAPEVTWKKFGMNTVFNVDNAGEATSITIESNEEEMESGNKRVTSKLIFNKLKPTDTGVYTCTAINTAGTASGNGTVTVEFKPNFDGTTDKTFYGWAGASTNITCRANGEPQAYIEWTRNGEKVTENTTYKILPEFGKGFVVSHLRVSVELANENWIYGDYLCTATNGRGSSALPLTYAKANKPGSADVTSDNTTPTSIELLISPPANDGGQPVTKYQIDYQLQGNTDPKTIFVNKADGRTNARITGLEPDSVYSITVRAMNAVGAGTPRTLSEKTPTVRRPDPVTFKSDALGTEPNFYIVSWEKPLTGGKPLTGYKIDYKRIEVKGEDESEWEVAHILEDYDDKTAGGDVTNVKLEGLKANSYYQVDVVAVNALGESDSRQQIFKTSKGGKPVVGGAAGSEGTPVVGAGIPTEAITGAIIAILIILFIIIDISFYFNKKCGVLWTLQQKLVGKPSGDGDAARDMEEGDKENKQPLLTEAKTEDVNEEEVPEKKNEALEGVMEETTPEDKEAKQLAEMEETSPIKPDSPIVPQSEATIIVNPATPEAESQDDKPVT